MAKVISSLIAVILLLANPQKNKNNYNASSNSSRRDCYRVYKIDSINNYYLIYAKKEKQKYKIISEKVGIESHVGELIQSKSCYKFNLEDIRDSSPVGYNLIITRFGFEDGTSIGIEANEILTLHTCDDLKGLYFIEK